MVLMKRRARRAKTCQWRVVQHAWAIWIDPYPLLMKIPYLWRADILPFSNPAPPKWMDKRRLRLSGYETTLCLCVLRLSRTTSTLSGDGSKYVDNS